MTNIRLIISYDGTRFFGWQKTKTGPSIEEELEKAITQILGHSIKLQAASRTDRGVHAKGQVVHFTSDLDLDPRKCLRPFNAVLPLEISVLSVDCVDDSFHPTLDAISKEYHYFICNDSVQAPMNRLYSWHIPQKLNIEHMLLSIKHLIGCRNFSAFSNERTDDAIRTIHDIRIIPMETERLRIEIHGDNFLYKMARNLVGTLVQIGQGKRSIDEIPLMIESKKRENAGMTAPAHGLFLMKVFYSPQKTIHLTL